ncbi:MAG: hypothetical protein C5B53_10905 [Candidatus Melainabacteria bacterium]|nr:MAG: hypothetical protein C5B53_10905 [Candidatus Melainabacteria bacterium]
MKFSGLFRTGALALIISGQLAGPNLALSEKEQIAPARKPLLKSEKDSSEKTPVPKPSAKDAAVKSETEKKNAVSDKKAEEGKPPAKSTAAKLEMDKKNGTTDKKTEAEKQSAKSAVAKPEVDKKSGATDKKSEAVKPSDKSTGGKQAGDKKTVATDANSSTSESKKNHSHSAKSHSNESGGLIPPPPAFQPSYLINPGSGIGGIFQPEFMTKEMALQRLKDVEKQFVDAKSELDDKTAKAKDMKDRSERFASLYTEGVVSRHECEAAAKEAEEAQKDLEQFKSSVAELESEKKALNDRVKPAAKKNLQASKSPNNHKRRAAGSRS